MPHVNCGVISTARGTANKTRGAASPVKRGTSACSATAVVPPTASSRPAARILEDATAHKATLAMIANQLAPTTVKTMSVIGTVEGGLIIPIAF